MRWPSFFRRKQRDEELAREIESYIEHEVDEQVAAGVSPQQARSAARKKFGNTTLIREEVYRRNSIGWIENLWRDLRYAARLLRKNPGFTAVAVLTLALGIGANTAMFTVINTVLLKPLPYRDPSQLVRVSIDNQRHGWEDAGFSQMQFKELERAQSFVDLGASFVSTESLTLSGGTEPEALKAARVSANFLNILGVEPVVGRSFLPEEDDPSARPVAMISSDLWNRYFGRDPAIAGRTAAIDSTPHTIIGVLPSGFQFPFAGVDVWVTKPWAFSALPPRQQPRAAILAGLGRLKPGVSLEQVRAELTVLHRQYSTAYPALSDSVSAGATVRVAYLKDQLVADIKLVLWVLFGAVGCVLLIACANLASLLLARAGARRREFSVRAALGAGRRRLIGHLLTENLLLSFGGALLGLLLAKLALAAITQTTVFQLPRASELQLDGVVLGFTAALSIATAILFGLLPSLAASRPDVADVLRARGEGATAASRLGVAFGLRKLGLSTRGALVVCQVALSMVLLVGATLMIKTLANLHNGLGFDPASLLTFKVNLPQAHYDGPRVRVFLDELVRRLEATPGVRQATVARTLPTEPRYAVSLYRASLPAANITEWPMAQLQTISPGYFRTLGIPLRRGRKFTDRDGPGPPFLVMINEALARRFWPAYPDGEDPVGQHILVGPNSDPIEIVGVVGDIRQRSLDAEAWPEVYVPVVNTPLHRAAVAVRTDGNPMGLVDSIQSQVFSIDPEQAISEVMTMEDLVALSVGRRRAAMTLLALFASTALLLSLVGIYGVVAYSVVLRTQELGIRRALGAQRNDILRQVLGQGIVLTLLGVVLGTAAALAVTRLMQGLLFGVSPTDFDTFLWIALLFVTVAATTSYVPARRATKIDPMTALRCE